MSGQQYNEENQNKIATRALEIAMEAKQQIESHQEVCAEKEKLNTERYNGINETLKEIKQGQQGLYNRFWMSALAIIGFLTTAMFVMLKFIA